MATEGERAQELVLPYTREARRGDRHDLAADVVVVGTGAAGLSAAVAAAASGRSVLMLEKGRLCGGTTALSGGAAHVYNNAVMRAMGLADPRHAALAYMARCAYPGGYDPDGPTLGLTAAEFELLCTYYDSGSDILDRLTELGAASLQQPWITWSGELMPDYHEDFPENEAPRGRALRTEAEPGRVGRGADLVAHLMAFVQRHGSRILPDHSVVDLLQESGRVTGVVAEHHGSLRAARCDAVVFASGGFAHDAGLRRRFLPGPVVGGAGSPTNTGDFLRIAMQAGADIGSLRTALWDSQVLGAADDTSNSNIDVWDVPGDSMVVVNRLGRRLVNEKTAYQMRGRAHHAFTDGEYLNRVLIMVYDERVARLFAGRYPIPEQGAVARHVVRANGLDELGDRLAVHLETQARTAGDAIAPIMLSPHFVETLRATIARFNGYARTGRDEEFGRGTNALDRARHGKPPAPTEGPNQLMHPIDVDGPLYAILLVGAAFETTGGPRTDADGRVLAQRGGAIPGLYAAGNCAAAALGEGYAGGGTSIGPNLVFGFRAGRHAATRATRLAST